MEGISVRCRDGREKRGNGDGQSYTRAHKSGKCGMNGGLREREREIKEDKYMIG